MLSQSILVDLSSEGTEMLIFGLYLENEAILISDS